MSSSSSSTSQPITSKNNKLLSFLPNSFYSRTFLILTLIESTLDIIIENVIIIRTDLVKSFTELTISNNNTSSKNPLTVYLGIFILAHLFQIYYAFDALRQKNTIQLIGLCGFNLAVLGYAIIQVPEIKEIEQHIIENTQRSNTTNVHSHNPTITSILLISIPLIVSLSQIGFSFLTFNLFQEFGWQIYKQIGADRKLKRIYMVYQIFICLLKFDYFFLISFTLQLVLLVPSVSELEKILTILALPTTLVLLGLGYYGVRNESETMMGLFELGLLSGSCYFAYKLFRIWKGRNNPLSYQNVFKSLTVFSVLCLLMTLLTFTLALVCTRNFGKGLKVHTNKRKGTRKKTITSKTRFPNSKYQNQIHLASSSNNKFGTILSKNHQPDGTDLTGVEHSKGLGSHKGLGLTGGGEYEFQIEDEIGDRLSTRFESESNLEAKRMTID